MIQPYELLDIVSKLRMALGLNSTICLVLTTSNEDNDYDAFFGGCRTYKDVAILSIVNLGQYALSSLIPTLRDLRLNLILVDTDKKHPFEILDSSLYMSNLVSELQQANFSNIVPFSSTKITADSVVNKLIDIYGYNLSGATMSVVGLGSIGFQVSLDLVRQGVNVNIHSRNHTKGRQLTGTINILKSEYTLASANYFSNRITALAMSTVLIDCSSSENLYNLSDMSHLERLSNIITVSKKSFSSDIINNLSKYVQIVRTDVSSEMINLVLENISSIRQLYQPASRYVKGSRLISGGFKGIPGDIVVDSANNPTMVLGVVNSRYKIDPIYKTYDEWIES